MTAAADIDETTPCLTSAGARPGLLWWLAVLALTVALALPFCLVDVPPVLDYPNHLARLFVLAHPDDPVLSQIYTPHWRILPNLGMDILGTGLLKITSVHVGGRLLLALSLFAPVIGVIVYHRAAFGRFAFWPLASGVIATNGIFQLGFMNFLLSLGLALWGAALWLVLRRRHCWWLAAAAGALAVSVIFFAHLFGVVLFALLIGGEEMARLLARWRGGALTAREVLRTMTLLALTLVPAVVLFGLCPLAEGPAEIGKWRGVQKLWALFTPFMTTSIELTLVTGVAVFCAIVLLRRYARWAPGGVLVLAVLGGLFVLAPSTIKNGTFVDIRLALMMGLVLFAVMLPGSKGVPLLWSGCCSSRSSPCVAVTSPRPGSHTAMISPMSGPPSPRCSRAPRCWWRGAIPAMTPRRRSRHGHCPAYIASTVISVRCWPSNARRSGR